MHYYNHIEPVRGDSVRENAVSPVFFLVSSLHLCYTVSLTCPFAGQQQPVFIEKRENP